MCIIIGNTEDSDTIAALLAEMLKRNFHFQCAHRTNVLHATTETMPTQKYFRGIATVMVSYRTHNIIIILDVETEACVDIVALL